MDFLLECIGFPPSSDVDELARLLRSEGEPVALRGPRGTHLRLPLAGGIEVRLDREEDQEHDSLWPYYESTRRLRIAVDHVAGVPDSPFDALLRGRANPPLPEDPWREASGDEYPISTYVCDARRLPRALPPGHVLAVSLAGFSLDVTHVGPDDGVRDDYLRNEPRGAQLLPVEGADQPAGCMELSLVVTGTRHFLNPLTGEQVELVEADAPGRPLDLFLSRWQLEARGLEAPRPGWRVEGAFLFQGRIAGGLPVRARPI